MKKIVRKLFMVALLLTIAVGANAQRVRYPGFHFGIRAGFSSNNSYGETVPFVHGGLAMDFRLGRIPLYFETGAYVMHKGYFREYWDGKERIDDLDLYIPLLFSYHIYLNDNIALQPFTGVTVGFLTEKEEFEAAYRLGVGFNFKRLYFNMGYDFGLTKHDATNFGSYLGEYRNNTFFLTLGFNFAGRR